MSTTRFEVIVATVMRASGITGMQTHTDSLAAGLRSVGSDCVVTSAFDGGWRWLPIFAVRPALLRYVNKNWSTRWYRHWHHAALHAALKRELRRHPRATVVAQDPLSADAALHAGAQLALDVRVVLVCHFNVSQAAEFREKGELDDERAYRQIESLEERVLAEVDAVVFVSQWARHIVEVERGIAPRASHVIYNGIPDAPAAPPKTRRELGFDDDDDVVLVTVGTLEPRKNQLGLLEVFARLAERNDRAKLVVVGDGPQRTTLARWTDEHALSSRVRLLGARDDVPAILSACDAYVHFARLENLPFALLEAARAGLPVAAAPVGGIAELLEMLGGMQLSLEDSNASAAVLDQLVNDAALRRTLGARARDAFARHLSQAAMTQSFVELICPSMRDAKADGRGDAPAARGGQRDQHARRTAFTAE